MNEHAQAVRELDALLTEAAEEGGSEAVDRVIADADEEVLSALAAEKLYDSAAEMNATAVMIMSMISNCGNKDLLQKFVQQMSSSLIDRPVPGTPEYEQIHRWEAMVMGKTIASQMIAFQSACEQQIAVFKRQRQEDEEGR